MKYRIEKLKEKLLIWIAWALPRSVVYWCYIRVHAHATTGKNGHLHPDEVKWRDALDMWGNP